MVWTDEARPIHCHWSNWYEDSIPSLNDSSQRLWSESLGFLETFHCRKLRKSLNRTYQSLVLLWLRTRVLIPGTFLLRLNKGGSESITKTPFTISRIAGIYLYIFFCLRQPVAKDRWREILSYPRISCEERRSWILDEDQERIRKRSYSETEGAFLRQIYPLGHVREDLRILFHLLCWSIPVFCGPYFHVIYLPLISSYRVEILAQAILTPNCLRLHRK